MDYKKSIIDALDILRKKELANKETWKARAYSKAIKTLKEHNGPVSQVEDVANLPGIGAKIAEKIREIIETGHLRQVNAILKDDKTFKLIDELMTIHGIGPTKANELVKTNGIKSIDELIQRQDELLNDKQKMGLKYVKDIQTRIPRKEMLKHDEYLMNVVKSVDPSLKAVIAGSYRRGEPDSGDIDVLLTGTGPSAIKAIVDKMQKDKYIVDILALGDKKCMAICRLKYHRTYRRIDLMFTKPEEFAFAVLYFTGSAGFNVAMRNLALSKGLSLSEHGLKSLDTGEFLDCHFETEEDIFQYLDMKYVAPNDRKNATNLL